MKKLLLLFASLLAAPVVLAQAGPQIPLSGSIGVPGSAPTLCSAAVVMPSDANFTLTANQFGCNSLYVTSSVSLTATRNIVAPLNYGQQFVVTNATTGGQSIQVVGASGAGVTIPNGQTEIVNSPNGTNYVAASSVGSGSATAFPALVATPTPASTTFLQALNNAKNVPVHVAVMGDSFTVTCQPEGGPGGGPLICTNRWPEQLRIQLQAIYGSHGTGVYPVILTTTPLINNQAWSCTGSFTTSNILGPFQSGASTLVALGPGASCTFHDNRNIAWDTLNTYCGTNASSVGIAVSIDSGAFTGTACGSTTGSAAAHVVALAASSSTSHSVTFTNSAGSGTAYLYAAEGQAGTTGVSVDNMGLGGAVAGAFGATPSTQLAFSDLIPGGAKALLFMDQTNDASLAVPTGTFSTNVQNLITHEQALASAPTVMLTIPPVDVINNTAPMAPYTAVQLSLCTTNSLTCVNIQDRGTTVGSTAVGWGTSFPGCPNILWDCTGGGLAGIHPNDAGNLDEAQLIYARLVNPAGTAVPTTSNLLNARAGILAPVPGVFYLSSGTLGANSNCVGTFGATGSQLVTYLCGLIGQQSAVTLNQYYNGSSWIYDRTGNAAAFRFEPLSGSSTVFEIDLCPSGTAGSPTAMATTCIAHWMQSGTSGHQTWLNPQVANPTFPTNAAFVLNPSANWWVDFSGNETARSVAASTDMTIGGISVCQQNGTNCPPSPTVTNITLSISGGSAIPSGCGSPSTISMPGLITTSTLYFSPQSDQSTVNGWSDQTLYLLVWPTANTFNWRLCNRTGSPITPSAGVNFNIGAQR